MSKKYIIYIIIFLSILKNIKSSQSITTIMAPENGSSFIIMIDNGSTNSYIKIGNNILLGDETNPIIIAQNNNINYTIAWPIGLNTNLLGINQYGQLITTSATQLGENGKNEITCPLNGNITITSHGPGDGNIMFTIGSDTDGSIKFFSNKMNLIDGGIAILGINPDNTISTTENLLAYIGSKIRNYITIDNTSISKNGITINTPTNGTENITLAAGGGNIILISSNIDTPSSGNIYYLGINDNNEVTSLTGVGPIIPGVFTSLSASENVSLGTFSSGIGANISIPNNNTSPINIECSSGISLQSNNSSITLSGSLITPPLPNTSSIIISLDAQNNIVTSNGNYIYSIGEINSANNYISVDNINNTAITLNGSIFLQNSGFILPGLDQTAILTIDNNGQIGILLSSNTYKKNIKPLNIKEEDFQTLIPYEYEYINKNKKEFGLIAEEVYKNQSLKDALVVLDKENNPLTINYQAVLIALLEQFLKYKQENKIIITKQNEKINLLENKILYLLSK